ncbi:MAG: molybdopterin-dependent oxidoreductase, partial [Oscillospiraceae bacterium]|nr:molybdopterin-dependent oxidoreductase [Oscillospiraceae bacterium]
TGNIMSAPDTGRAGVYLGWAFNPYYSRNLAALGVEAAKKQGMKVIIVDPRITPASLRLADLHLRPQPGTDGALALGLAHILIRDGHIDREYIRQYVYGFAEYAAYVKAFDPEKVEQLTRVPATEIEAAARMIAEHLPLAISESAAPIAHHSNGFQNYRAIMALSAITGCFDRPGGQIPICFSYNYQAAGFNTREAEFIGRVTKNEERPAVGAQRYPLWGKLIDEAQFTDLARQIRIGDPYPLKALIGFGLNYRVAPGSTQLAEALKTLDFLADVDLFLTDSAKLCDIVLPACTSFERSELKAWSGGYLTLTSPVISPLYQSRPDIQIICDLAREMQLEDPLLIEGPEACMRYLIADLPVTLEELAGESLPIRIPGVQSYQPGTMLEHGLATPSGKFELYSLTIQKCMEEHPNVESLDCLPTYREPLDQQDPARYPFTLCSGPRIPGALHSRLHDVPWARSLRPSPMADLNPTDAEALEIAQGDGIEVFTPFGRIYLLANLTSMVDLGTIYIYHGYREADVNSLMDPDHVDPYSGFPAFRSCRAGVRKKA